MKKTLRIVLLFVLTLIVFTTVANAATPKEKVMDFAKQPITVNGETFKLSESDLLRIEKYFNQYPINDETADQIIAKGNQVIGILQENKVADPMKLPKDQRKRVLAIAQEAASLAQAKLTYDSSTKTGVVTNGNVEVDRINMNTPALVQTGSDNTVYVVAGVVAVIAIATITIVKVKKSRVNA